MDAAIEAALSKYTELHPLSKKQHEVALASMPGGNTRTLLYTPPFPVCMVKGQNHKLYDKDGNEYFDFVGELTAGLFGHSNPPLQDALIAAIRDFGLSLGATNPYEHRYASLLCDRFSLENIRFTNSGTEANIHCIAAARKFTRRRKIVAFRGAYHGGVLSFSTGPAENNIDHGDFIVLQYNDILALQTAFNEQGGNIAAVLVEGMQASGGFISALPEFLEAVRTLTEKNGALFIMDEVVTSRLAPGGIKSLIGAKPDMVTLGKYLGGGMPFGAFGGRADVMAVYDPRSAGFLSHSGTFQNNTLMLHTGYVGMSQVYTSDVVEAFNGRGDRLRARLQECVRGTKLFVLGRGSLLCIHATKTGIQPDQVLCKDDVAAVEDIQLKKLFWLEMINTGFWVQLRGSMALNLQLPDDALDALVAAVGRFCSTYKKLVAL